MTTIVDDPHAVLGVAPGAPPAEIRRAYRRLAKACHPDCNPDPNAAEQFRLVKHAYEVLTSGAGTADAPTSPADTDQRAGEQAERADDQDEGARARARAEDARRARDERRRDRIADARRIMARRIPDAREVQARELTGWSYRPAFAGLTASLVAVYDDDTDTFAALLVDLTDAQGPVTVDGLVDDRLLPIGRDGRCPSLDDALDRSFFWLTRQAWGRRRLTLGQAPATGRTGWSRGEADRVLALLGITGRPGADALISAELDRLAGLIRPDSTGESVRTYLERLIDWLLTQEVSQWP